MDFRVSIFDIRTNRMAVARRVSLRLPICNRQSKIRSRGFSFTEILFAVMILGVGFIMLAAIFPVGLSQTKSNFDENVAASIGKLAVENLRGIASETVLPATPIFTTPAGTLGAGESVSLGTVMSFRDRRWAAGNWQWDRISRNMLLPSDSRFAWTAMYIRKTRYTNDTGGPVAFAPTLPNEPEPIAQLIVIGLRINNRSEFAKADLNSAPPPYFYQIEPKPVYISVFLNPDDGSYIARFYPITDTAAGSNYHGFSSVVPASVYGQIPNSVASGAVVVISDDRVTAPVKSSGYLNGRIFRVGEKLDDAIYGANTWALTPGNDAVKDPGANGLYLDVAGDDVNQIGNYHKFTPPNSYAYQSKSAGNAGDFDGATSTNSTSIEIDPADPVAGLATAYVIGRGYTISDQYPSTDPIIAPGTPAAPSGFTSQYENDAQDVSVYTTFVRVNK